LIPRRLLTIKIVLQLPENFLEISKEFENEKASKILLKAPQKLAEIFIEIKLDLSSDIFVGAW
jgi:hypothetical protein